MAQKSTDRHRTPDGRGIGDSPRLTILTNARARALEDGRFEVSRKFRDGAAEFAAQWPGPVEVIMQPRRGADDNLDNEPVTTRDGPFDLSVLAYTDPALRERLAGSAVILCGLGDAQLHLPDWAADQGVPLVFITEYSYQTRVQIIAVNTTNPITRLRRELWNWRYERRCVRAMRKCAGLQCNGTPTYEAYRELTPRPLLFFDSRMRGDMVLDADRLEARLGQLEPGAPLRLVYSGRLSAMKGADELPEVAAALRQRDVPFALDIFGGGPLEQYVRQRIDQLGLDDAVHLRGVVDFQDELVPHVCDHADLFVCCHPQGDPSCTYLETMACGVPIAGYDNEAWRGIQAHSGAGWLSPVGDPQSLAERIAALTEDPGPLADAARRARAFAREHTFEKVIATRVEHLRQCAELIDRGPAPDGMTLVQHSTG